MCLVYIPIENISFDTLQKKLNNSYVSYIVKVNILGKFDI